MSSLTLNELLADLDRFPNTRFLAVHYDALESPYVAFREGREMALICYARVSTVEGRQQLDRQRVLEGMEAACGRKGGRPRIMTADKLRYAQHLMADHSRSIPDICRDLDDIPTSTLYHYLHADGTLKKPARRLLGRGRQATTPPSQNVHCRLVRKKNAGSVPLWSCFAP